ncbi:hypothetical protein PVAND_015410 [Polypedilum vanderplanki]|uniref:Uncharacterized protein n=1 Tax=Polypedilum vanderplanki TaxID=319348 RepID=A0A9J6BCZ3_POLVA|nr:hypothetical protein PVAND_015410 [Polypedilum vanderplanki]
MNLKWKILIIFLQISYVYSVCVFRNGYMTIVGGVNNFEIIDDFSSISLTVDENCNVKFSYKFKLKLPLPHDENSSENFKKILLEYMNDIKNVRFSSNFNAKLENLKMKLKSDNLTKVEITGECTDVNESFEKINFCHRNLKNLVKEINVNELMMRVNDINIETTINEDLPQPTMPELYEYTTADEMYFDHSVDYTTSSFILPLSTTLSSIEPSTETQNTYHDIYDTVKNDFDDEYYSLPTIDLYPQLITKLNRNSTLFSIQAVISVPWNDNFSNISSEMFIRFSSSFSKYTEAVYEMDPLINGTIIACKVEKIAKDFFMKYDKLEFNENDVILNFFLETVGFSITNENDLNLGEGNIFDKIFKNFKIHEFLKIFDDKSEVLDEYEYDYDDDDENGSSELKKTKLKNIDRENSSDESKNIYNENSTNESKNIDEKSLSDEIKSAEEVEIDFSTHTEQPFQTIDHESDINDDENNENVITAAVDDYYFSNDNLPKIHDEFMHTIQDKDSKLSKNSIIDKISTETDSKNDKNMSNANSNEKDSDNGNLEPLSEDSNISDKNENELEQSNENFETNSKSIENQSDIVAKNGNQKIHVEFEDNKRNEIKSFEDSKNEIKEQLKFENKNKEFENKIDRYETKKTVSKEVIFNHSKRPKLENSNIVKQKIVQINNTIGENIQRPSIFNHYESKVIRIDSRGVRTVKYHNDGLQISNVDSYGVQTYTFTPYGVKIDTVGPNGIRSYHSDGNGLKVVRNEKNELILINSDGYEVDFNNFEYELMKPKEAMKEKSQNGFEIHDKNSHSLQDNNNEKDQSNSNENDIGIENDQKSEVISYTNDNENESQPKHKDYNDIVTESNNSYDYDSKESEESTQEEKTEESLENLEQIIDIQDITEGDVKEVTENNQNYETDDFSGDNEISKEQTKDFSTLTDDEDYNEIKSETPTTEIKNSEPKNIKNENFIIEAFEAYKIEGNVKKFICRKCKMKINKNNDIEILTDDHESNHTNKSQEEITSLTEQQVTNTNENNNDNNKKIKHKYIWRYFMRLYAENEFDRSERVICEKCEIKMTPDGKFEIIEKEKLALGHENFENENTFRIAPKTSVLKITHEVEDPLEVIDYSNIDFYVTSEKYEYSTAPKMSIENSEDYQSDDSHWRNNTLVRSKKYQLQIHPRKFNSQPRPIQNLRNSICEVYNSQDKIFVTYNFTYESQLKFFYLGFI